MYYIRKEIKSTRVQSYQKDIDKNADVIGRQQAIRAEFYRSQLNCCSQKA